MDLAVGIEHGIGGQPAVDPVARADRFPQLLIAGIGRMGLSVIDEIAVQIDIVLVYAPDQAKPLGLMAWISRMAVSRAASAASPLLSNPT